MSDAVLAQYVRDGVVESEHRGHLLALNADGSVNLSLGELCNSFAAINPLPPGLNVIITFLPSAVSNVDCMCIA